MRTAMLPLTCFLLLICGCAGQPKDGAAQAGPGGAPTVASVQSEVMSFADTFISAVAQEWNRVTAEARAASSPEGLAAEQEAASRQRRAALAIKLANAQAALAIASSPNPYVAAADMITMVSLQRMVLESPGMARLLGPESAAALVRTYQEQERRAWRLSEVIMTPEQREDLAALILQWRKEHPDDTYVSNVRLEDFSAARQQTIVTKSSSRGSLLSLLWLDPLAGVEPAEREVQKTRLLGERMFYYASRSPQVLKWQVESLYQDLFRAPEFRNIVASVENVNQNASRITSIAEQLPTDVAAERSAALNQFFDLLARERSAAIEDLDRALAGQRRALIADLEDSQQHMQATLEEFRRTAESTDRMAVSLTGAIRAADELAGRFDSGEAGPQPAPEKKDSDTVRDVRDAAAETGAAAERLTRLARSLDDLMNSPGPSRQAHAIQDVVLDVQTSAKDTIEFAFRRLLILVLVTPFSIAAAAMAYRWMTRSQPEARAR